MSLAAYLVLFGLLLQVSAFGHWAFGPFQPERSDPVSHARHCHGNASACADLASAPLSQVQPASVLPGLPQARRAHLLSAFLPPAEYLLPVAEKPPRFA